MGAFFDEIPDNLIEWIKKQHLFHVATAPLNGGHVNVSPKGGECFHIVNNRQVYYLDCTGSGNETISHLYEPGNARLTIMFESFEGAPRIVRLYGKGRVIERGTQEFEEFYGRGEVLVPGARSVIILDITKVGSSCGYSVPLFEFVKHRDILRNYFDKIENPPQNRDNLSEVKRTKEGIPEKMIEYWAKKNADSVDGLPGLKIVKRAHQKARPSISHFLKRRIDLFFTLFLGIIFGLIGGIFLAKTTSVASLVELHLKSF